MSRQGKKFRNEIRKQKWCVLLVLLLSGGIISYNAIEFKDNVIAGGALSFSNSQAAAWLDKDN